MSREYVLEIKRYVDDPDGSEEDLPLAEYWELVAILDAKTLLHRFKSGMVVSLGGLRYWPVKRHFRESPGVEIAYNYSSIYRVTHISRWK